MLWLLKTDLFPLRMKYKIKNRKVTIIAIERGTEKDYKLVYGEKEGLPERGRDAAHRAHCLFLGRLLSIIKHLPQRGKRLTHSLGGEV